MPPPGQMGHTGEAQTPQKEPGLKSTAAKCTLAQPLKYGCTAQGHPPLLPSASCPSSLLCPCWRATPREQGGNVELGQCVIEIATDSRADRAISRMINTISTCWSFRLNISFRGMDFDVKREEMRQLSEQWVVNQVKILSVGDAKHCLLACFLWTCW